MMSYVILKILSFFLVPSSVLIGIGLVGIILTRTHFARAGTRFLIVSIILLFIVGVFPVGIALTLPLEARFPPWQQGQSAPTGIIVLGGAINPVISEARGDVAINDAAERITTAVELARRYPNARVVFSGGNGNLFVSVPSEAVYAARLMENLGVSRGRIMIEGRSRSTAENAAFTAHFVQPKPGERWLLITSAMHMPRAMGTFRKAGFLVEAYPVDYRTAGPQDLWEIPESLTAGVHITDMAVHEWLGLLAYWISDRSSTLFPAPN
jgi:uncharacterized SAM-binding protein YcdF (DUF218 family)